MWKKIIFILSFLFFTSAHAEKCPTLSELKSNVLHGWQALDLDNAEPLSNSELKAFERNTRSFGFATWIADAPEGTGHCYYNGEEADESYLNVFLVKNAGEPDKSVGNWRTQDFDLQICDAGGEVCRFK